MGCLIGLVRYAIYIIGAVALWRLWGTTHHALWWCILVAMVLNAWTARTAKAAYEQERELLMADNPNSFDLFIADQEAQKSPVVNFWVKVNIAVAGVAALLSLVGLVISFR